MECEEAAFDFLVPKTDIQVKQFLQDNSRFDGKNVTIAILDQGIDPAAPGLQQTSDGRVKVIDIVDCTGSGDVDTSTVQTADIDGYIVGLSGTKLKIPSDWSNPSGQFHVGLKDVYSLYPTPLLTRMKSDKREQDWLPMHRLAVADTARLKSDFENKAEPSTNDMDKEKLEYQWKKENLEAQADLLTNADKLYTAYGPVYDCIVFHDGSAWKACIDSTCEGKLVDCKVLQCYREAQQFYHFGKDDFFTYSINIYESGNVLEISTTTGSHGTHVGGIAASYFPDDPSRSGVAPGAQLVSLCIGDRRASNETGSALLRAISICIDKKVDLINYSYGESSHWDNDGSIIKLIETAVYKHGILFISSAGNNGPCLTSVGTPGGTCSACIGVGAYLTPDMSTSMYSVREAIDTAVLYPWSSRGPTADGDLGVTISACGGAITSMPNWSLKGCQLMNGTSMSSPSACGGIACILSGLKAEKRRYSQFSVRQAIINTACVPPKVDRLSIGYGLIQVSDAFKYMCANTDSQDHDIVRYDIKVDGKHRGLYLRELEQVRRAKEATVSVEPIFHQDTPNDIKVKFHTHLTLECDVKWVKFPDSFSLVNSDGQFSIKVDPSDLPVNVVHATEIRAIDKSRPNLGPLWRVPITVIIPEVVKDTIHYKLEYKQVKCNPSKYFRHFVHAPVGAEYGVLTFKSHDTESFGRFVFHTVQVLPKLSYRSSECYKMATLTNSGECTQTFNVVGGRTIEICFTKWWSSLGEICADYTIEFFGLSPSLRDVSMMSHDSFCRMDVTSNLKYEELSPAITLKYLNQPLRPTEAIISPLGPRDLFSQAKQSYQLVLTYQFNVIGKGSEIYPYLGLTSDFLYESEIESQMWMVFNSVTKQYLFGGDAFPWRTASKLEKGDYTLLMQLRHDDKEVLEKLRNLTVCIKHKLTNSLSLDVFNSYQSMFNDAKKLPVVNLGPKARLPIYIASLASDKIPKNAGPGWFFSGQFCLPKDEGARRVNQFPFRYILSESSTGTSSKKKSGAPSSPRKQPILTTTLTDQMNDSVRDLKISWLAKLPILDRDNLFEELAAVDNVKDVLPLYVAQMKALNDKEALKNAQRLLEICDTITSKIDSNVLLQHFGTKNNLTDDASSVKSDMNKKRDYLIEAMVTKGCLIADKLMESMPELPELARKGRLLRSGVGITKNSNEQGKSKPNEGTDSQSVDENNSSVVSSSVDEPTEENENVSTQIDISVDIKMVDESFAAAMKFADAGDSKVLPLTIKHALVHQHWSRTLKYLIKFVDDRPNKELDKLIAELYELLGWVHIAKAHQNLILVKYQRSFAPF